MLSKLVQFEKTKPPISVTLFGIAIFVRLVQPEKALSPMLVTLSGMVIAVRFSRFENAFPPRSPTCSAPQTRQHYPDRARRQSQLQALFSTASSSFLRFFFCCKLSVFIIACQLKKVKCLFINFQFCGTFCYCPSDFSMSSANFPLRILPKFQQIYKKSALNQTCIVKNREIITNILHRFQ